MQFPREQEMKKTETQEFANPNYASDPVFDKFIYDAVYGNPPDAKMFTIAADYLQDNYPDNEGEIWTLRWLGKFGKIPKIVTKQQKRTITAKINQSELELKKEFYTELAKCPPGNAYETNNLWHQFLNKKRSDNQKIKIYKITSLMFSLSNNLLNQTDNPHELPFISASYRVGVRNSRSFKNFYKLLIWLTEYLSPIRMWSL